jgi:hypothetical protein
VGQNVLTTIELLPGPEPGAVLAGSQSRRGVFYLIRRLNLGRQNATCSCPAGLRHRPGDEPCKHVEAAIAFKDRLPDYGKGALVVTWPPQVWPAAATPADAGELDKDVFAITRKPDDVFARVGRRAS